MKKLFLIILTVFVSSIVCLAQSTGTQRVIPTFTDPSFTFNSDATFTTGSDKEYVVYKATGYKKTELYKAVLLGLYKLYSKPEAVISSFENELIIVNAKSPYCVKYGNNYFAFSYTLRFLFKDGKIRVDTPIARAFIPSSGEERSPIAAWIKVQDNYEEVKPGFEKGISEEVLNILNIAFSQKENAW